MDLLLLIILAVGLVMGIKTGAVRQLLSLAAFFAGLIVASLYCESLAAVMGTWIPYPTFCKVVAFLLLWMALPVVAELLGDAFTALLDVLVLPGLANRLAGGVLGLAKYALVLGSLIWLASSMHIISDRTMQESRLCLPLKALPETIYNALSK